LIPKEHVNMHDHSPRLHIQWQTDLSVLSLRGESTDIAQGAEQALGLALPLEANTTDKREGVRCVWVSPDDWFVLGAAGQAAAQEAKLREALQGKHFAVTDVSSGYYILSLSGTAARALLAQGCPLDLHPSAFRFGQCAGSHFFKASVWLWLASETPRFDVLVRRSFAPYVDAMLGKASLEYQVERAGAKIEAYV
jgi:sarcosine oxidase, subunit gamma